ncbi:TRAP transporter large permease [Ferruginivarius sediminum]|uniref:TRAP transporter large permease protein n=1 Tax=Ferruginivarius sediminum TaxID=2661937 RepID=A0A369TDX1_9PROT|nr:TRAP transporter large permease subunit [Ferruginivarius sediminum]RDD62357.1 TRAP transporter large permease [Ferruginivarius sediminum]
MSSVTIGVLGLGILLVLLGLRVPIAFALGIVSVGGIAALRGIGPAVASLETLPYNFIAHWSLSAVPMFLLMGNVAYHTGLTESLFRTARLWLSRLPGGLAIASTAACAGFAAASGSSVATASAMGRIAIPEMLKYRYDPGLATGSVAAAGTLGSLIPPSILMILFAIFAEASIGKMLIAGILPGLLSAAVFAAMIITRCVLNPKLAPPAETAVTWRERFTALQDVWPLPVLVVGVLGGIYTGFFTPTEAGAGGAFIAFVIAAVKRRLNWTVAKEAVLDSLKSTSVIFFIALGGILLTRFMAMSGVPIAVSQVMEDFAVNPVLLVIGASVIYIVLGMFLDSIGLMLLTLPILLPMFEASGAELIWFGVLVIKYLEIGLITPPVGLNVYVIKSVVGNQVPLETIFKGILWFVGAELVTLTLLIAFPEISLVLPDLMQ